MGYNSFIGEFDDSESPINIALEDYSMLVTAKIRSKYSQNQELAIIRQKDEKPNEWQAYYDYCEQCKKEARAELNIEP